MNRKQEVYDHCVLLLSSKIETLNLELKAIQEDANKETKSSAGDKYETGRAMSQLQKDNTSRQLVELLKLKKVLDQLTIEPHSEIKLGSLVETDSIKFFVSVGLSEQLEGNIYCLSPVSPLCREFLGKKEGDEIIFRNKKYIITSVQ